MSPNAQRPASSRTVTHSPLSALLVQGPCIHNQAQVSQCQTCAPAVVLHNDIRLHAIEQGLSEEEAVAVADAQVDATFGVTPDQVLLKQG